MKIGQKRGKIIYFYQSVDINFFIVLFKILSILQELLCGKIK